MLAMRYTGRVYGQIGALQKRLFELELELMRRCVCGSGPPATPSDP